MNCDLARMRAGQPEEEGKIFVEAERREGAEGQLIERVAIVGAGTMGSGIAQVFAEAGVAVTLVDAAPSALQRAMAAMERNWSRSVEKSKRTPAEVEAARSRIALAHDIAPVGEADMVIEAVFEDVATKQGVLRDVDRFAAPDALLATNTSSISITQLAAATERPGRVIGMHFFNPVPVMPLVEVVRGLLTQDETVARVLACVTRLGKTPVEVHDFPGFVSNRVLLPMINEAIFCLQEGVADKDAIDAVMRLGMAHPMGPLALADLIGLDVCLNILDVLQRELGEDKYRPAPLLRKMVAAGKLGRKSGEGFFLY